MRTLVFLATSMYTALMTVGNPSQGGIARRDKLTQEERSAIARNAVIARWGKGLLQATHTGVLPDPINLECAVLEDGTRLLSQVNLQAAFGLSSKKGRSHDLPPLLVANNIQEYITDEIRSLVRPITYVSDRGNRIGYKAEVLPEICSIYLRARDDGKLVPSQYKAAELAYILVQSLAKVGIIALVDEATGFQRDRDLDDLQRILKLYIAEEFQAWTRKFPPRFFREVFRIYGWKYIEGNTQRPGIVGSFINKYIYEQLPDGVIDVLKIANPVDAVWQRKYRHHQKLSETGNEHLNAQITKVIHLMEASDTKEEFFELFNKSKGRSDVVG